MADMAGTADMAVRLHPAHCPVVPDTANMAASQDTADSQRAGLAGLVPVAERCP